MSKRRDKMIAKRRKQHMLDQKAKRARGEKQAPRVKRRQPKKPK